MSMFRLPRSLILLLALLAPMAAKAQTVNANPVANPNKSEIVNIGGTPTANDIVSLVITDAGLSGGSETVSYTVLSGDNELAIANGLRTVIEADSNLAPLGLQVSTRQTPQNGSVAAKVYLTIASNSSATTTFTSTVNSGASEVITLAANANSRENATVGGTFTTGDVLTISVSDAALPAGQTAVSYTVQANDTAPTVASNLVTQFTSLGLKNYGISASSALGVVTIQSDSPNVTTYTSAVVGASETLTLSVNPNVNQIFTVSGTVDEGAEILLGAIDPALSSGHELVKYTVPANATLASVAQGIAAEVNADASLSGAGISASAAVDQIVLVSNSSNASTIVIQTYSSVELKVLGNQCAAFSTESTWPGPFVFLCETSSDTDSQKTQLSNDAQTVLATVGTLGDANAYPGGAGAPDAAAKLAASQNRWYLYQNHADMYATKDFSPLGPATGGVPWWCADAVSDKVNVSGVYGYTLECGGNAISTLFEDGGGQVLTANQPGGMVHDVAHETGHQVDYLYGVEFNNSTQFSKTSNFSSALNDYDIPIMQSLIPCAFNASDGQATSPGGGYWAFPNPNNSGYPDNSANAGGLAGYFTDVIDPSDSSGESYLCSDSDQRGAPNGAGRTAKYGPTLEDTLTKAYGNFFQLEVYNSTGGSDPRSEIFAEEYAFLVGYWDFQLVDGSPVGGSDSAFGFYATQQGFACTQLYVQSLTANGSQTPNLSNGSYLVDVPDDHGQYLKVCDGSSAFGNYHFAN